jgi:hypothetical protein
MNTGSATRAAWAARAWRMDHMTSWLLRELPLGRLGTEHRVVVYSKGIILRLKADGISLEGLMSDVEVRGGISG